MALYLDYLNLQCAKSSCKQVKCKSNANKLKIS
nr:MAG TPA: hypothetical protein [Caudoviricetes sp.]